MFFSDDISVIKVVFGRKIHDYICHPNDTLFSVTLSDITFLAQNNPLTSTFRSKQERTCNFEMSKS